MEGQGARAGPRRVSNTELRGLVLCPEGARELWVQEAIPPPQGPGGDRLERNWRLGNQGSAGGLVW